MRTTVIKDTFGNVDTKKYSNLDYTSEADFKASIHSTLEGNQLEITKFFVDRLQTASFLKGTTDNSAVHVLQLILFYPIVTKIMKKGFMPEDIVQWYSRQWLHPVVQLWFKILPQPRSLRHNNLTAMGLLKAGQDCLHIEEVDLRLVLQLETEQKAFTMIKDLCEHLPICTLTSFVKDLAHRDTATSFFRI
eukprot:1105872-Rhodomonas_salina.1